MSGSEFQKTKEDAATIMREKQKKGESSHRPRAERE
jgi:hypothetical protein